MHKERQKHKHCYQSSRKPFKDNVFAQYSSAYFKFRRATGRRRKVSDVAYAKISF